MKITIEVDGHKMVMPDEMIDGVTLQTPMDVRLISCDCPVRCKSLHREFTGTGTFELKGKLLSRPVWVEVAD
jgi:hypothetical protein